MASIALTTSRFPTRIRIRCTRVPRTMDAVYVIFIAFIYHPSRPHPHPIRIIFYSIRNVILYDTPACTPSCIFSSRSFPCSPISLVGQRRSFCYPVSIRQDVHSC